MAFVFVRWGFELPVVVARSPPVRVSNRNEPLQGRLSLTGDSRRVGCLVSLVSMVSDGLVTWQVAATRKGRARHRLPGSLSRHAVPHAAATLAAHVAGRQHACCCQAAGEGRRTDVFPPGAAPLEGSAGIHCYGSSRLVSKRAGFLGVLLPGSKSVGCWAN